MKVISGSHDLISHKAAALMHGQLESKPGSNFAFAWGQSPRLAYQYLAELSMQEETSFAEARAFAIDEYLGLRRIGEELLRKDLYDQTDLSRAACFNPLDVDNYDGLIEDLGGIDLMVLGLGRNGHIAACEPGTPFDRGTHLTALAASTIEDNFGKYGERLLMARTLGPASIMKAATVLLLICGEQKQEAARRALYGAVTVDVPASILQTHENLIVLADFELPPGG
ncbi:MAG: 6-phosphogluconolactonase [Candidatus Obscuribacter sp.]|jgi:glucosamine-6-phosphate deaminase|nr:6-phosphogluconolactonase [Candidatus Obscuribacter sp.]